MKTIRMGFRIFIMFLLFFNTAAQSYTCDDTPENNKGGVCECDADICYFKLVIEHLQTFTAYENSAARGTQGRVYYFNSNGSLEPATKNGMACENLSQCTKVHTVDGSTYRSFIAINKQIPGPTLIVNEGATVVVDVFNFLTTEETSIHWHGVHQRNTPWMDGVGYISQCPIQAGGSFRYIFKAEPSGTFWYHSHSGPQRTDGLFGALIVRESQVPDGLPAFEDEPGKHTLTLLDWQREASLDLFVKIHSSLGYYEDIAVNQIPTQANRPYMPTCSADGAEVGPVPYWSGIINGRGKYKNVDFIQTNYSSFDIVSGKTYRFRLIGAQGNYAYRFSIDSHKLLLVGTDGYFIEPVEVDFIIIHTGERYDFLLTGNQPSNKNYLIRAETLEVNCSTLVREKSLENNDAIAVLTYNGSPVDKEEIENEYENGKRVCNEENVCIVANCPFENYIPSSGYNCSNLHVHDLKLLVPTAEDELPKSDEVDFESTWFFNFGFDSVEFTSTVNGRNFILPTTSLQTQGYKKIKSEMCKDLSDQCDREQDDCTCVQVIDIGSSYSGKTVRFVFSSLNTTNGFSFAHPIHLHGHSFFVAKTGYGSYNSNGLLAEATPDITCGKPCLKAPTWTDGKSPAILVTQKTIRKDTVMVPAGGYVVVEFVADNPGFWFLHCHIETHQLEGMALVINAMESLQNPSPSGMPECGNFNWTVKEFKKKLFKPGTNNYLAISVGIPLTILLLIVIFVAIFIGIPWIMFRCKKKGYKGIEGTNKAQPDLMEL